MGAMVDVEHGALCAFEKNGFSAGQRVIEQDGGVGYKRSDLLSGGGIFRVHLVGVERLGIEKSVRDHIFLAHRILDVLFEQMQVQQVGHAQAAASHFVFVGGTD